MSKQIDRHSQNQKTLATLLDVTEKVELELQADLYLFSAGINTRNCDQLVEYVRNAPSENRRKNCVLALTTFGGSADAAYMMVRQIKRYYSKFTVIVMGFCKSAGTLIALGADEIVFGDFGELGPLDVQVLKEDELVSASALNHERGLDHILQKTFEAFELYFLSIKGASQGNITTRTASEIAAKLAIGLLAPIAGQIEPEKLGEVVRSNRIAREYGTRLACSSDLLEKLVDSYPSHEFSIDYQEAAQIFGKSDKPEVRMLNDVEKNFERHILKRMRMPPNEAQDPPYILSLPILRAALSRRNDEKQNKEHDRSASGKHADGGERNSGRNAPSDSPRKSRRTAITDSNAADPKRPEKESKTA